MEEQIYSVKASELQAVANYLNEKPYKEAAPLINILAQIAQRAILTEKKPIDQKKDEVETQA